MDCITENDIKNVIADNLSVDAKVERVEVPEQRGLFYYELHITLILGDRVISKTTIDLPHTEEQY